MSSKSNPEKALDSIVYFLMQTILIVLGGIVGLFIFSNFSYFLLNDSFIRAIAGAEAVLIATTREISLTEDEQSALKLLLESGRVVTQEGLLEIFSQFYNNIINGLIVVISVLSVLAYFSVKSLSKSHAEDIAREATKRAVVDYISNKNNMQLLLDSSALIQEASKASQEFIAKLEILEDRLIGLEFEFMNSTVTKDLTVGGATNGNPS